MSGRTASFVFLTICVVIAVLLMAGRISATTTGWTFAIAMVVLGLLSGGFRRK